MSSTVPEHWDIATDAPTAPAQPLPLWALLPAALVTLILPRRIAARLAGTSVFKALLIHIPTLLLSVCGYLFWVHWSLLENWLLDIEPHELTTADLLRLHAVMIVEVMFDRTTIIRLLEPVIVITLIHGSTLVGALFLLPFVTPQRQVGRGFLRAWRLTLWAAGAWIAVYPLLLVVGMLRDEGWLRLDTTPGDLVEMTVCAAWVVYLLMILSDLAIGAARLNHGPIRHQPVCTGCGYILIGLPTNSRCPECGLPVADSLPRARQLPRWAQRQCWIGFGPVFWQTLGRALCHPHQFFTQLSAYRGLGRAVTFAWRCALLAGLLSTALGGAFPIFDELRLRAGPTAAILTAALIFLVTTALFIGAVGILISITWIIGRCDARPSIVGISYGAALLLPGVAAMSALVLLFQLADEFHVYRLLRHLPWLPTRGWTSIFQFVLSFPALAIFAWSLLRLARAARATRHAAA